VDLEGSRSKGGGDEAAGNRQAPPPRTLPTRARLLEPYSSQKEEVGKKKKKIDSGKMSCMSWLNEV
jgi:hypothetical protein